VLYLFLQIVNPICYGFYKLSIRIHYGFGYLVLYPVPTLPSRMSQYYFLFSGKTLVSTKGITLKKGFTIRSEMITEPECLRPEFAF